MDEARQRATPLRESPTSGEEAGADNAAGHGGAAAVSCFGS